jgi:osmotically-inducible protein OsmY
MTPLRERDVGRFAGRGPANYAVRDERVFEDVCEALADDGEVDASLLRVHVSHGDVALVGDIADDRQRALAVDCARGVRGVRAVHDHLRVVPRS